MIRPALLAVALLATASAADPLAEFQEAMRDNDWAEKKAAINALTSWGEDSVVIPALIGAVGDRQAGEAAVRALRQRTGMKPASGEGDNSGYPGYPRTDTAGGWTEWWNAKVAAEKTKDKLEQLEQKVAATTTPGEEEAAAAPAEGEGEKPAGADPTRYGDLGKLDRVFFTDGSSKLVYIIVKRVDLDGNLTSLRIVHRDGAGEELLSANIINRIEEDVK